MQCPENAFFVPIQKKGNLSSCDNWYGILLKVYLGSLVDDSELIKKKKMDVNVDRGPEEVCLQNFNLSNYPC